MASAAGRKVLIPYGNARMAGILRKPAGIDKPPVVIVMGGIDSVRKSCNRSPIISLTVGWRRWAWMAPVRASPDLRLKIEPRRKSRLAPRSILSRP